MDLLGYQLVPFRQSYGTDWYLSRGGAGFRKLHAHGRHMRGNVTGARTG